MKVAPLLTPNVKAWSLALIAVEDLGRRLNRIHGDQEGYDSEAAGRGMKTPEHGDAIRWAARAEATLGELAEELRAGRAAALYGVEFAGLPDWEPEPPRNYKVGDVLNASEIPHLPPGTLLQGWDGDKVRIAHMEPEGGSDGQG